MRLPVSNPLLAQRDGKLFFLAQALDALSIGVASVALPWLVLDGGGSKGEAGLVFAFLNFPYVLFGLPAGVIGDRFSRRRVIATCHAFQALTAFVIPLWAFTGTVPITICAAAAFGIGTGRVFADAAAFGAVSNLVGGRGFTEGQAALNTAWASGQLAGPALGGVLIGFVGAGKTMGLEATAFVIATIAMVAIRRSFRPDTEGAADASAMEQVREGLQIIFKDAYIRTVTFTSLSWNLVAAGSFALLVPLLRESIHLSSTQAGIALAAGASTGLVSAPIVGYVDRRWGGASMILGSIALFSIAMIFLGLATGFVVALITLCAVQLSNWVMLAGFIGERQRRAPQHLQARVGISGRMVVVAALTGGSVVASGIATFVDLRLLFVLMALASLLVAAAWVRPLRAAARTLAAAAT